MSCECCDRECLMQQVKCLRKEKEELERQLATMTAAYHTATKMVNKLHGYIR